MTLVRHILEEARKRLAVLSREASICEAAAILTNPNTSLVVVCDNDGTGVGVISRTDIVKVFGIARAAAADMSAEAVMTKPMFSCQVDQTLQSAWELMSERGLRCAPILDEAHRPQGVLHARDVARSLMNEVTGEELQMRDYVLGIGYQ